MILYADIPGERLDDLQCEGLKLIQRPDAFRFGTDSVLLADFAAPRRRDIAVDLGCGTGILCEILQNHSMKASGMDFSAGMIDIPVAHDTDIYPVNAVIIEKITYSCTAFIICAGIDQAGFVRRNYQAAVSLSDICKNNPACWFSYQRERVNTNGYGQNKSCRLQ